MCCISSFGPVGKKQKQEQLSFALTADEKRNNCGRTESFVDTHKQIKKNSIFYRFENEKKNTFNWLEGGGNERDMVCMVLRR